MTTEKPGEPEKFNDQLTAVNQPNVGETKTIGHHWFPAKRTDNKAILILSRVNVVTK